MAQAQKLTNEYLPRQGQNKTLHSKIPNPYQIPGTPYSINFHEPQERAPYLSLDDVVHCISYGYREIDRHIREHGDSPIAEGDVGLGYRHRTVEFGMSTIQGTPVALQITYSVAAAVLGAYSSKLSQDGYLARLASIFVTEGGRWVGDAFLTLAEEDNNNNNNGKNQTSLQLHPIQNPYPMPGTPFSLDFYLVHAVNYPLAPTKVMNCILAVRREVFAYVGEHGNKPIPALNYRFSRVDFEISPILEQHMARYITYRDVIAILLAYSLKMSRESYRARCARVIMTEGGELVGEVLLL